MLKAARVKIAERGVTVPLVQADMRNFDLGQTFKIIFVAAQSLSHLYTREDVEACFAAVQRHLAPGGRFIIELFNPSVKLLAREPGVRYTLPKSEYDDPNGKGKVIQTEEVDYDSATQVMQINWFFRYEGSNEEPVLSFEMRQFFPQEIDALLNYNGFEIEHKFGDFEERPFGNGSPKQLIVCKPR
jgi:SAM-dependent methyltransferase